MKEYHSKEERSMDHLNKEFKKEISWIYKLDKEEIEYELSNFYPSTVDKLTFHGYMRDKLLALLKEKG